MAENLQTSQVIAKIFGVSTRRVEQLKTEGIIKGQGKPTKYDLLPTIQAYIRYLSDKANGREKKETDSQLETEKLEAEKRIKMAKAEMAERLYAAKLLLEGKTYNQVIEQTDISSATLSRVSRCVQYGKGYSKILKDKQKACVSRRTLFV